MKMASLNHLHERSVCFNDEDDEYEYLRVFSSNFSKQSSTMRSIPTPASELLITATKLGSLPSFIPGEYRVPMRVALFLATILEDVLVQLRIFGECNNKMCTYKMRFDMQQLREKKFGITPPEVNDEPCGVDPKDLECDNCKIQKTATDTNMCFTIIANTYLGLVLERSYKALVQFKDTVEDRLNYYQHLIDEETKNKVSCHELKKQLHQQRNRTKSAIFEINEIVDRLITNYEDSSNICNCRGRYIDKWERSRSEQHAMQIKQKETKCSNLTLHHRIKADEEQRIHTEVEDINNIRMSEVLKEIEGCMSKFEKDVEDMDVKITIKRINYETELEKRLEIEQKLADHGAELQKWIQLKTDREKLRAYHHKMESAAITVQAWWRGLLVRLALGPFKQIKQKKNKNKKKKKK